MRRIEIAPGAFITELPGDKFKRCKIAVNLVVPSRRQNATTLAVLPHVLDRRCKAIPDAIQLSRHLFSLYGADLTSESYTAGASRVLTIGIAGLKDGYALAGEKLAESYVELLCNLLFHPVTEQDIFSAVDVSIEKEKQADFLRSEMNDKRGYCLRQARRKLFGNSPLGVESAGYLDDLTVLTPQSLYDDYAALLREARVEVFVCGAQAEQLARPLAAALSQLERDPAPMADLPPLASPETYEHYSEPMSTTQGKLAIICSGAGRADARGETVMRMAGALYGGLPTSRLFLNVREKQSLCYYCAASYGYFSGTLTIDSGVDHKNAQRAAQAILHELEVMQKAPVTEDEMQMAKRYLSNSFAAAQDSPDALMSFAFNEWLKGMNRSLEEMEATILDIRPDEVMQAIALFKPAVEYVITEKEGAAND